MVKGRKGAGFFASKYSKGLMILVVFVLVIGVFFLFRQGDGITGKTVFSGSSNNNIVCNKPYILVGAECCLDKDDNLICDSDEADEPADESGQLSLYRPAEIEDLCEGTVHFDCVRSELTKEGVNLKFKMKKPGIVVIKKVELLGLSGSCAKELDAVSFESGLRFGDVIEINVPCSIKREYAESYADVYVDYYPRNGFRDDEMTLWSGDISVQQMRTQAYVGGMVI